MKFSVLCSIPSCNICVPSPFQQCCLCAAGTAWRMLGGGQQPADHMPGSFAANLSHAQPLHAWFPSVGKQHDLFFSPPSSGIRSPAPQQLACSCTEGHGCFSAHTNNFYRMPKARTVTEARSPGVPLKSPSSQCPPP